MKFNEQNLKDLLQQETSPWEAADLSWFDADYLNRFENQQLNADEHQQVIDMLANDQTVMNHYLQLKQQNLPINSSTRSKGKFVRWLWVSGAAAALLMVFMLPLEDSLLSTDSSTEYRSPKDLVVYPEADAVLAVAPGYLIAPVHDQPISLVLRSDETVLWQTAVTDSPRVYLPMNVQSKLTAGEYQWQVLDANNQVLNAFKFRIEE